jgi:Tfp pilus assembly protein PilF
LILEALGSFWLAHGDAGISLTARRDAFKALKYVEEGIEIDPAHGTFYEMAAEAYEKLGDPANANLMRKQASQLNLP